MSERDTGSFRFGSLDEEREDIPADNGYELVELKLRKLNRRFWWLLFLVVLLVGGLFAAGYWDLKNRFTAQKSVGIREIENISTVFDDRLNEFQERLKGFETTLAEEMAAIDKKTVVWQKDLAGLRKSVENLDLSGAVEKEQQAILQEVRKEIAPLDQKIAALQSELEALAPLDELEEKLTAQIAPLSKSIEENRAAITALQDRLPPVAGEIVTKDEMDLEMLKLKKALSLDLADQVARLERRIGLLTEQIERIESRRALAPPSTGPGAAPTAPGGIQEQPLP